MKSSPPVSGGETGGSDKKNMVRWPSGEAEVSKTFYGGSTPSLTSREIENCKKAK